MNSDCSFYLQVPI